MAPKHAPLPPGMPRAPDFADGAVSMGTFRKPLLVDPNDLPEAERDALLAPHVCGECRHWDYAQGQAEMRASRFLPQLVKEHGWQVHHLAAPANQMGFCGAANSGARGESRTLTAQMNRCCDQFAPKRGLVSLTRKGEY